MKVIENLNIPPFTRNFKQNANAWKFSKPLTFNAHNLKTRNTDAIWKQIWTEQKLGIPLIWYLLAWQSYLTKTQNFDRR